MGKEPVKPVSFKGTAEQIENLIGPSVGGASNGSLQEATRLLAKHVDLLREYAIAKEIQSIPNRFMQEDSQWYAYEALALGMVARTDGEIAAKEATEVAERRDLALGVYANSINDDILRLMFGIREMLKVRGIVCQEPEAFFGPNLSYDEYKWGMATTSQDGEVRDHDVSMEITLEEQAMSEGQGDGISFSFIANALDGKIVAQFIPGNYTVSVWVDFNNKEALAARLEQFVMGDYHELGALIEEHFREVAAEIEA
jgi:hypothetical protein